MSNAQTYKPNLAIHPGRTLLENLEYLSISQVELSERTGITTKHISQIINSKASITPETALKLERVLGVQASFWNNLEKNYKATVAKIESEKALEKEVELAKEFPYQELVSFNAVPATKRGDWKERAENLMRFFRVDSLKFNSAIRGTAFRNLSTDVNQKSLAAWLRFGEIQAEKVTVNKFDLKKIKETLKEARGLTYQPEGFGKKLQKIFSECGIAVVYAPYFKNTKINGGTRWVGDKAIIQLNTKGAFSDVFWFTFFHEVGHLVLHGKKEQFLDFDLKKETIPQKEKEANRFATEQLISNSNYDELLKKQTISESKKFCDEIGIDFGILAGRLAHDKKMSWREAGRFRRKICIEACEE